MKNDIQPNYFAVIPAEVRYCENLPANAKLLYGEITALSNKEGFCWATNNYFAKLYNKHPITISSWVAKLEKYDFIKCILNGPNIRKIYIVPSKRKHLPLLVKTLRPSKRKHLELYNNKKNNKNNLALGDKSPKMLCDVKNDFYLKYAKKLNKVIQKNKTMIRPVKDSTWVKEFIKLINSGYTKQELKDAMDWLIKNYQNTYTPKIYKIKNLQEIFPKIMQKIKNLSPNAKVKISQEVKDMFKKSEHHIWPKVSKQEIQNAMQISYDNYKTFRSKQYGLTQQEKKKFNALLKKNNNCFSTKDERLLKLCNHFYLLFKSPKYFIPDWFDIVYKEVHNWANWNGSLSPYMFNTLNKRFQNLGQSIANDYGNEKGWGEYMAAIDGYDT